MNMLRWGMEAFRSRVFRSLMLLKLLHQGQGRLLCVSY